MVLWKITYKLILFNVILIILSVSSIVLHKSKTETFNRESHWQYGNKSSMTSGKLLQISTSTLSMMKFPIDEMEFVESTMDVAKQLVFVTAATSDHIDECLDAIGSVQHYFPLRKIIFFGLKLHATEYRLIKDLCNVEIRQFEFSGFPDHVANISTYAWKALVIHQVLLEYPVVFWIDASVRMIRSEINFFEHLQQQRNWETYGVLLFENNRPRHSNFATTHPELFEYFPTNLEKQKMIYQYGSGTMLFFRTKHVYKNIIHWFVLCSLYKNCIAPEGSNVDCHLPRSYEKAHKSYLNCHRFDQSLINILLTNNLGFNASLFTLTGNLLVVKRGRAHQIFLKQCNKDDA